ncbi:MULTISPECIES: exodeoxyribonuclease VII small subunit [Paenibacillus]|uniref:Exodeoxyribonuclease 7 small subunit n=1 Tax=Paenibacillus radicis (ex Gao et al. 2016) TaxID=1737354 RepID=A0A917GUJ4_9BACL|nr:MULTISPECIES: exodeoxyribonuclease VII small subunit [Paenibacillus]GGG56849.1 exodeoxyribonuclease 7 small subunit [Paenibacillus radicis (ex Gao et al. 2016)]
MEAANELSFEEAMEQLEQIVEQLESGDVPLEKAIDLFQQGMKLSQLCGGKLEQVEKKIELLIESEQGFQKKTFAPVNEDKGESF